MLGGGLLTLLTTWVAQRWQTTEHREERAEQKQETNYLTRVIAADDPSNERMGHDYDASLQQLVAAMRAEQRAS